MRADLSEKELDTRLHFILKDDMPNLTLTSSPARSGKKSGKREALLQEAARQIIERGAGALNLNDIAETVGLSRNTLYYYVSDRFELLFLSYLRSCEEMTADIDAAVESGARPAERLTLVIEKIFAREGAPLAVLSDLDVLPDPQRATIAELNQRNVDTIARLIRDGVAEGQFRPVNTVISAQCLMGMIGWARMSSIWLGLSDSLRTRRKTALAINDLILNGIAARPDPAFHCGVDIARLDARIFNAFDKAQASEQKASQLINAASLLFNRRGCDGASLDEVSASVGATKGAIYHYFEDKNDLVTRCYERAFGQYARFVETAVEQGRDGLDQALHVLHLNCQAQAGTTPPLMPQPGLFALPDQASRELIRSARAVWASCQEMVDLGMADGSVRNVSSSTVTMAATGAFLWLPKWLPAEGAENPMRLADQICDVMRDGLLL